ncbi:GFA family protein [Bordetella sp. N]|uniref:GFA family protein n=1 Tax=Bordetella sp. N TaxID=1746199 RepID=UPI00070B04CE|nr:GFA family protein [Bordetella sp. N]ALM84518.1 aldehyde-activating protein [Bordetella sp. N]
MKVEGRCHCGAVAFEAEVDPATVAVCHCADCQKQSGSAFRTNVPASADRFHLLKGTPRRYIKTADSGNRRVHAFCENCGTPIYACAIENPQTYSLRVGTLDQRQELGRPARQIWTKRQLPWLHELDTVPGVEGQPKG